MSDMDIKEQLLQTVPGGIARIALNDELTILFATDTFYSLIKNATDKANSNASLGLLRIVYSADIIYLTQQLAAQKNRKDNLISLNFRTLQPSGGFRWVMITGSKTEEIHQLGTKSAPVYACIAMDVTDHMVKYKKLDQETDYHRTIAELSKELYFEYEIATDTLTFTELFSEVFGKDSVVKEFSKKLDKTKMVHPTELPAVIKIFKSMMSGKKQVRFEVRLLPKEGLPVWYVCYASIIFDENRNPYKVIGKLATTNPLKKDTEATLVQKETTITAPAPQLDSLTQVCAKDSAEALIKEAISKKDTDTLSSLLLVEVRNYKGANEIMRAINGENVLSTIANLMKSRVRTSDIIGRLSLSEFVIYLKDIRSDNNAYEIAEQLCKLVEEQFSYHHNKNSLSISIGICFGKGEQVDYPTLIANAKTALIMAKKENNSSFDVFYGTTNS